MDLELLLESPAVQHARARIHAIDETTVERQVRLASIPAPPFGEDERGRHVHGMFGELGLQNVRTDEVGNIFGDLPRPAGDAGAAPVLVSAHLDTVFPRETDLTVRRENGRICVPGIADNARGLAGMLTLIEVLCAASMPVGRPIVFVATVGEEGAGDLRGVKHIFREGSSFRSAAAFFSLDGSGLRRIVHRAVGSTRLRVRATGAGGHSWSDWGAANPLHALGSAVHALRALELPASPRTTLTVARMAGGTSVNAIPEEAWMEMDLRSEADPELRALERRVREAVGAAVDAEARGRRPGTPPLELRWETIGDRPGGAVPDSAPLVRAAVAATRALGATPKLVSSSTDANVPISLGIPAITLGVGGESGGIHTNDEWYSNEGGPKGIERALLAILAAAA